MTRETKIGLLVGLAFIIVIGILLSDHMAATTEPTQAALDTAANHAREAVVVPNEGRSGATVPQNVNPRDVVPHHPVPTREELVRTPVVRDIQVTGPGSTVSGTTATPGSIGTNSGNTTIALRDPVEVSLGSGSNTTVTPGGVDPRLAEVARNGGEELTHVGPSDRTTTTRDPGSTSRDTGTTAVRDSRTSATKTYTVESGDTLGRIAAKTMGANTKANRDAIMRANQISDPNKVVIGQVYQIPAAAAPIAPAGNTRELTLPLQPTAPREARVTPPGTTPPAGQSYTYVVKPGDTGLWMIAREQLGTPAAVPAIKELNKDVLKGGDTIRVGMRLKMPSKPVASAN